MHSGLCEETKHQQYEQQNIFKQSVGFSFHPLVEDFYLETKAERM